MKKLLVTAIGAAAALGASADLISTQRFENVTGELPQAATISSLNELAGGNFWSGDELTNTYTLVSRTEGVYPQDLPFDTTPTKALEVKTTFGSPLTVKAIAGNNTSTNIPASGIYFDSLVKFTVCEEAPEQTYEGAKIIMWLEEEYASDGDTILGTNIMVRASYVNADGTCTPTNFVCKPFSLSIDDWHRVTIKTLPNIVNGNDIPGFVIFLNGSAINVQSGGTMASEIAASLTEAAKKDGDGNPLGASKVFASLVQGNAAGKSTITSASFDGTGKLTDLVFTDVAPFDAAENWESDKANVYDEDDNPIDGSPFKKLADAVAAVNVLDSGTYTFKLANGIALTEPLAFTSEADVILDFAGFVLTNDLGVAAITNNSANLVITNSVGVGGIYCVDYDSKDVDAIYNIGTLTIGGGTFWGLINVDPDGQDPYITGGTFQEDVAQAGWVAAGKTTQETAAGLFEVVDYVPPTFTATFVTYDGSVFEQQANITSNTFATAPGIAPTRDHYTFTGWAPAVADTPIVSNTTFTATWTPNSYTITFVYGLNGEKSTSQSYTYGLSPELPGDAKIDGYALVWNPAVETVTSNTTYTAHYEAMMYTITYNEPDGAAFTRWADGYSVPSTFTVASVVTLPVADNLNLGTGATFNNWTNAAGQVIADTTGLTSNLVVFANLSPVVQPTYPSYIDTSDSKITGEYAAWAEANNVASGNNTYEADFLLNVAPGTVGAMLTSTDVSISGTTITIDINRGNLNGYVYIQRSATLAGLAGATKEAVDVTPADGNNKAGGIDNGGSITLTDSGDSMFYRIGVQIAPVAVPNP